MKIPLDTMRVFLILGTCILGEVGFFPFGPTFRLGLGSVFYMLCLDRFPRLATFHNAWAAGIAVVLFRVLEKRFAYSQPWITLFLENSPAILYYVALTTAMIIPKVMRDKDNPIRTSLYFMVIDFLGNILELIFSAGFKLDRSSLGILGLGAGIKGLFFLAFIATVELYRQRILQEKEREKFQRQLMLGATLYAEGFFLKKIMRDIEETMVCSFQLYQQASQDSVENVHQSLLLNLAEKIHEIKKDTQRVFSSLNAIIEPNDCSCVDLSQLMKIVLESQRRYANAQHKTIKWITTFDSKECRINNLFPILVVVNNILANGIDAIEIQGEIAVIWQVSSTKINIHLGNTGKPISPLDRELIFLPGFTTKYSKKGNPSTGIGLTHVQHVLKDADGEIKITQSCGTPIWTWFHIHIPIANINRKVIN
jgi:Histidine kinase-, DNA gyrase B-, and HSP90-like ATPase.